MSNAGEFFKDEDPVLGTDLMLPGTPSLLSEAQIKKALGQFGSASAKSLSDALGMETLQYEVFTQEYLEDLNGSIILDPCRCGSFRIEVRQYDAQLEGGIDYLVPVYKATFELHCRDCKRTLALDYQFNLGSKAPSKTQMVAHLVGRWNEAQDDSDQSVKGVDP